MINPEVRMVLMNARKRSAIFKRFEQANPAPKTELTYRSPFELLVSVILSAQATDRSVNQATAKLFPVAHTPSEVLTLGIAGLESYIRSIGLYRTKARNIIKTCEILIEQHNGQVPNQREALQALPGVGRKTANVVLNVAFNQPTIAVDTHIFRVCNRTGLARAKTPEKVEVILNKTIPKIYLSHAHHWLVLHGRYICTARKPRCCACLIYEFCEYSDKLTC
jgi:endonuclease III